MIVGITPGEGKEFPPATQLAADAVGTAGWVGARPVTARPEPADPPRRAEAPAGSS
jgi:hypothetical protein